MARIKVKVNGEETELEVTRQGDNFRVVRDGQTADVHLIHSDGRSFIIEYTTSDGKRQRIRAAGHSQQDTRHMWVNGRCFTYQRVQQKQKAAIDDDSAHLSATIPAVVSKILVSIGDHVTDGQKLILLESMKMVIPIQAQFSGTITSINCAAGDSVKPGFPLIDMEEEK